MEIVIIIRSKYTNFLNEAEVAIANCVMKLF